MKDYKPNQKPKKVLSQHEKQVILNKKKKENKLNKVRYHDVGKLQERIKRETPAPGEYLYDYKLEKAEEDRSKLQSDEFRKKYKINFSDLPISSNSIVGLQKRKFIKMTEIQRCTIPHIIASRDVLAASKTGSGKTLAYLVPLVERLYVQKWTPMDGLGAIVILPTRELATQVFEVYNSFTANHDLSVGLIIGGKSVKYEKENMKGMNVLICTPGRLLQHMDETPDFDCSNLQMLVIDEADQILELGFQEALNAILYNLPKSRQTVLFSATLSKSIHELSKLSLKNPEHVFLHDVRAQTDKDSKDFVSTGISDIYEAPIKLTQYYMEVKIEDKLNMLFSFLRSHKKNKVLVFLNTCKQVRFVYEAFRRLKLGPPVFELHGRQKQNLNLTYFIKKSKRLAIFFTYAEKKFGVLFTTNLAARGLDFPSVEWIIQVDCPEDPVTYLHRVGRTARNKADGNSLLMVLPSEAKMIDKLKEKKLNIQKLKANPEHQLSITNTLQSYLVENVDLKYLAQRAFISYVRSIFFSQDKEIFNANKLDLNALSESLGLIQTPVINVKGLKEKDSDDEMEDDSDNEKEEVEEDTLLTKKQDKLSKLKEKIKKLKEEKARKLQGLPPLEESEEVVVEKKKEKKEKKSKKQDEDEEEEIITEKKSKDKKKKKSVEITEEQEEEEEEVEQVDSDADDKVKQRKKPINVKHEKLVKRKNQDVFSENYKKIRVEKEEEDDFLVKKKKTESEINEENSVKINTLHVSKNQLKKIKEDGHFGGKNITYFTEDGISLTADDVRLQKYKENEKNLKDDGVDLSRKYILKLSENKEQDDLNERLRRKEKRDKRKMKNLEKYQVIEKRNEMVLGEEGDDDSQNEDEEIEQSEQQDYSEQEEESEEEEVVQKVKSSKKQKKNK